jgi:hypothetical protein
VTVEKPVVAAADPMAPSADPVPKPHTPDLFDTPAHEDGGVAKS